MANRLNRCVWTVVVAALVYVREGESTEKHKEGKEADKGEWKTAHLTFDHEGKIPTECGKDWAHDLAIKMVCDGDEAKAEANSQAVCEIRQCVEVMVNDAVEYSVTVPQLCCPSCHKDTATIVAVGQRGFQARGPDSRIDAMATAIKQHVQVKYRRVDCPASGSEPNLNNLMVDEIKSRLAHHNLPLPPDGILHHLVSVNSPTSHSHSPQHTPTDSSGPTARTATDGHSPKQQHPPTPFESDFEKNRSFR